MNKNLNNSIQTFKSPLFEGHEIRVFGTPNEPLFVAKDICTILGLENVSRALESLDEDEKDDITCSDVTGRQQKTKVVNESGLYSLVFKSKKEKAKLFKKWVTSDILPSIRKTGSYKLQQENQQLNNTILCLENEKVTLQEGVFLERAKAFEDYIGIAQFYDKNILYIGYIGIRNDKFLFKFGKSEEFEKRYKAHKKTFSIFHPLFIRETSNSLFIENYIKRYLKDRSLLTNFGTCREIFEISDPSDLEGILKTVETYIESTDRHFSKRENELQRIIAEKDKEISKHIHTNCYLKEKVSVLTLRNGLLNTGKNIVDSEVIHLSLCISCENIFYTHNLASIFCEECVRI